MIGQVRDFGYDYDCGYGYVKSVDSMNNVKSVRGADNVNSVDNVNSANGAVIHRRGGAAGMKGALLSPFHTLDTAIAIVIVIAIRWNSR